MTPEQRAAMKQALEALEKMMEEFKGHDLPYGSKAYALAKDARLGLITALTAALEQPAQKCNYPYCGCDSKAWCKVERNAALDKMAENAREIGLDYEPVIDKSAATRIATALIWEPKREWVGLTHEEIHDCMSMSIQQTCRSIEAKLKDKNGY